MKHWTKLALPVGLGLLAAYFNWRTVSAKIQPQRFVMVAENLAPGDLFTDENLRPIALSGDLANLPQTAIPWERRAVLYRKPTLRPMIQGDIVFLRDANPDHDRLELNAGEQALTLRLPSVAHPEFLYVGQQVGFHVERPLEEGPEEAYPDDPRPSVGAARRSTTEYVGPFRIVAVGVELNPVGDSDKKRGARTITIAAETEDGRNLAPRVQRLLLASMETNGERIVAIVPDEGA